MLSNAVFDFLIFKVSHKELVCFILYFQISEQFQILSRLQSAGYADNCRHRNSSKVTIDERWLKSWLSSPNCSFKRHFKQAAQTEVSISIMLDSWLSAVIILKSFQIPGNRLFVGALHAQHMLSYTLIYTQSNLHFTPLFVHTLGL